jgi:hypothetical protein
VTNHRFTAAAEREQADTIRTHESRKGRILADAHQLADAVNDAMSEEPARLTLARICLTAQTDEAEAGRQLRQFAADCAHECARWQLGDDAEAVEPPVYKPSYPPIDMLKLAGDICRPLGVSMPERNASLDAGRGIPVERNK